MIEYLEIINKIKDVKLDSITYFNEKVSIPLVLSNLNSLIKYDNKNIFIEKENNKIQLTESDRRAYSEIIYILKNLNPELYNRVDFKYIDFFEKFKLNNKENIDFSQLSDQTLKIICILNLKFWCESDEIKKEFLEHMNPKKESDIYPKKEEIQDEITLNTNNIKNKELAKTTWWTKLLNKIRNIKGKL